MRFFELLNFQHAIGAILVALIFMILFAVGLAMTPLIHNKNGEQDPEKHRFADNIEEGGGPFPLIMAVIIVGVVAWGVFYILYYGLTEVNI